MRRDVPAELDDDLRAVDQRRVARGRTPVDVDGGRSAEGEHARARVRLAPRGEEVAEPRRTIEVDDAGRVERADRRATARAGDPPERVRPRPLEPDPGRDDDRAPVREEL